jgi:hypothetical protein
VPACYRSIASTMHPQPRLHGVLSNSTVIMPRNSHADVAQHAPAVCRRSSRASGTITPWVRVRPWRQKHLLHMQQIPPVRLRQQQVGCSDSCISQRCSIHASSCMVPCMQSHADDPTRPCPAPVVWYEVQMTMFASRCLSAGSSLSSINLDLVHPAGSCLHFLTGLKDLLCGAAL